MRTMKPAAFREMQHEEQAVIDWVRSLRSVDAAFAAVEDIYAPGSKASAELGGGSPIAQADTSRPRFPTALLSLYVELCEYLDTAEKARTAGVLVGRPTGRLANAALDAFISDDLQDFERVIHSMAIMSRLKDVVQT